MRMTRVAASPSGAAPPLRPLALGHDRLRWRIDDARATPQARGSQVASPPRPSTMRRSSTRPRRSRSAPSSTSRASAYKDLRASRAGFDIEIAKIIAKRARLPRRTRSSTRRPPSKRPRGPIIKGGSVDLYVGHLHDQRQAQGARSPSPGPYYMAGQDMLVRKDDTTITGPDSLKDGKKVCSVTGSTPAERIKTSSRPTAPSIVLFDTYSKCVGTLLKDGQVDAVTTDDVDPPGYAAQDPDAASRWSASTFTKEPYGIGVKKDDKALRDYINDQLEKAFTDGTWQEGLGRHRSASRRQLGTAPDARTATDAWRHRSRTGLGSRSPPGTRCQRLRGAWAIRHVLRTTGLFWLRASSRSKLYLIAAIGALVLGTLLGAMRVSPVPPLRAFGTGVGERLPQHPADPGDVLRCLGLRPGSRRLARPAEPVQATRHRPAVLPLRADRLVLYTAAFVCEALRSGVNTVPPGRPRRPARSA